MTTGRILHTPTITAFLAGDPGVHQLVEIASRQAVTLVIPSSALTAAAVPLVSRYPIANLEARAAVLTRAVAVVIDHLVAQPDEGPRDPARAIRTAMFMESAGLELADAHTAAVATTRWWPLVTTRQAATELWKIEPRLAIDFI